MDKFGYQQKIERTYYKHGLFMSNHPILMICASAIVILCCCYPLLNLPLPGSEPVEFLTPLSNFSDKVYRAVNELPYDRLKAIPQNLPSWFQAKDQVAYIQQFVVKSVVHPWSDKEMFVTDAYRAPLGKIFTLLEEIENFHLEDDESHSITKQCLHVSESVIKPKQGIKPLFPEYGCLVLSPASFWKKSVQGFHSDPNIIHTIHKYQGKTIETSPSIKELLFGVSSKSSGVKNFIVRNRQRVITYAITLVLRDYDSRLILEMKEKLQKLYPSKLPSDKKCKTADSDIGGSSDEIPIITHIYFKPQIGSKGLIPLLSTYFIMGCYIYFSVRKINFVKSKLGMAFSAVISIMASLMISVGLCSFFGLKPVLNGGEIFPYLVIVIGLENILVITKSVVATPIHLEVDKRVALGLSREGCSITKNLLLELILIGLGYFTFLPEIQEFCAFAVVGILSDYFMHMVFFTTVLSIDIRRLDITEDVYSQPRESDSEEEDSRYQGRSTTTSSYQGRKGLGHRTHLNGKKSVLEQLRASKRLKRKTDSDEIHKVETGGKSVTILKIPKRLRVLFFWADTRMVQRGLMVCMVIWYALLMYGDPFGERSTQLATNSLLKLSTHGYRKHFSTYKQETQKVAPDTLDDHGSFAWTSSDLMSFRHLSFRHWPTLFAYYNVTLAGRFISILPPIPLSVTIPPEEAIKARHSSEVAKQHDISIAESQHQDDNIGQFAPYSYPMTGLDYYLTLLLGAVSGMMMVFLLTVMYRCICTKNYASWRTRGRHRRRQGASKYKSSIGDVTPLVLSGHPQAVDCVMCDNGLLASTDLTGEIRVWDIDTGDCSCVIHRVQAPVLERDPAEGAIDAKPTPLGYQPDDHLRPNTLLNLDQSLEDAHEFALASSLADNSARFYIEGREDGKKWFHKRQQSWHHTPKSSRAHHRSGSGGHTVSTPWCDHSTSAIGLTPFSPEIDLLQTINTDFTNIEKQKTQLRKRIVEASKRNSDDAGCSIALYSSANYLESGEGDMGTERRVPDDMFHLDWDQGDAGYDFEGIFHKHYKSQVNPDPDISSLGSLARLFQRRTWSKKRRPLSAAKSLPIWRSSCSQNGVSITPPLVNSAQPNSPSLQGLANRRDISGFCNADVVTLTGMENSQSDENISNLWGSWESGLGATTPKSEPDSWGSMPGSPIEMENGPSVWCMVGLGDFIITGCENGRIEVWDGKSGVRKCTHDVGKAGIIGLVAEDRKIVAARVNGSLDFFTMEAKFFHNPVQYRGPAKAKHGSNEVEDVLCSDVLVLQLLCTTKSAHQQPITAFKMAMGRVLTGSCDHTLKLFTVQDAHCLFTLYGHKKTISALYMDAGPPAGAASGSSDGTIRLWDLPSGRCLHMLDEHKGEVTSVQCSTTHIVSIAQDDRLCIWTRTGMLLHVRCLDAGCFIDMCVLGNSWCVTGGLGCVLLWDMRNGELVRKIKLSDESNGLSSRVSKLVPVANLAVACDTGRELQIVRFPSVLEKID